MRLGVTGKVLLAFFVLLVAFLTNHATSISFLQRTRQRIRVNRALLELQGHTDKAIQRLNGFEPRRLGSPDPNLSLLLNKLVADLQGASAAAQGFGQGNRRDLPITEAQRLLSLRDQAKELVRQSQTLRKGLGAFEAGTAPEQGTGFSTLFAQVQRGAIKLRRSTIENSKLVTAGLDNDERAAWLNALLMGVFAGLVALGAGFFITRTLHPLRRLRERTRDIAAGNYRTPTGVVSRDEIGELAQEIETMANALGRRERQLIRSERLATVGKMAAQITHEIRNPLSAIGLNVELLEDEFAHETHGRACLQAVAREVDRLSDITENYLRFVRLPQPELAREDIAELVTAVVAFSRADLATAGIDVRLDIAPELPLVTLDENQIRPVLLNLVRNAKEAMATGGTLSIVVSQTPSPRSADEPTLDVYGDDVIEITVTDTGDGLGDDDPEQLFEPFFTTKKKGTGLGLALARQTVQEHGGRIDAHPGPGGKEAHSRCSCRLTQPRSTKADISSEAAGGLADLDMTSALEKPLVVNLTSSAGRLLSLQNEQPVITEARLTARVENLGDQTVGGRLVSNDHQFTVELFTLDASHLFLAVGVFFHHLDQRRDVVTAFTIAFLRRVDPAPLNGRHGVTLGQDNLLRDGHRDALMCRLDRF